MSQIWSRLLISWEVNVTEWPGGDRRRYPRIKTAVPIEIRLPSQEYSSKGETADISLCGLYNSTMQQLPIGTEVVLKIGLGSEVIECRAVAKTSDPGVGNGLDFLDLEDSSREKLSRFLQSLQPDEERDKKS